MVSLPRLVSSLDFSKGDFVFFEGDGETRGLTGVEGEGWGTISSAPAGALIAWQVDL